MLTWLNFAKYQYIIMVMATATRTTKETVYNVKIQSQFLKFNTAYGSTWIFKHLMPYKRYTILDRSCLTVIPQSRALYQVRVHCTWEVSMHQNKVTLIISKCLLIIFWLNVSHFSGTTPRQFNRRLDQNRDLLIRVYGKS